VEAAGAPLIVLTDADNTLWDTNALYADAQLWMLGAVEDVINKNSVAQDRLGFLRELDQRIAESYKTGLRYPSRLVVRGLASLIAGGDFDLALREALSDDGVMSISEDAVVAIEAEFYRRLSAMPALRPGVTEGVTALAAAGVPLVCLTEGAKSKAAQRLGAAGLTRYFCRLVEARKTERLFLSLQRLSRESLLMVGDQLSKDIFPAKAAGLLTVYFPGGFRPKWENDVANEPDWTIESFVELSKIVVSMPHSTDQRMK
jgi:putative hydrolase of the HAD superfamily